MKSIRSGDLKGTIRAPSSKSAMQRLIAAAVLTKGETTIISPSYCDDGRASLRIARALCSHVSESPESVSIQNNGVPNYFTLDCGESGTSIRIFAAIVARYSKTFVLTGRGSLATRPLDMVEEPLRALGASVKLNGKLLPLEITGPIDGGLITVDGSVTSQLLSGLLMVLPTCQRDSRITVPQLKSKPYVAMTLGILRDFGIQIEHDDALSQFVIPGQQRYTSRSCVVEGDWSSASFPLVAGAIAGEVTVENLRHDSLQADRRIVEALELSGAIVSKEGDSITVRRDALRPFHFDATQCPDLFPPLVALAAACSGVSVFKGVSRLAHKESNRGEALQREFATLGVRVTLDGDEMQVEGGTVKGGRVHSHNDHRIAMACAVAALIASEPVEIEQPSCVGKSYPEFFDHLDSLRIRGPLKK